MPSGLLPCFLVSLFPAFVSFFFREGFPDLKLNQPEKRMPFFHLTTRHLRNQSDKTNRKPKGNRNFWVFPALGLQPKAQCFGCYTKPHACSILRIEAEWSEPSQKEPSMSVGCQVSWGLPDARLSYVPRGLSNLIVEEIAIHMLCQFLRAEHI